MNEQNMENKTPDTSQNMKGKDKYLEETANYIIYSKCKSIENCTTTKVIVVIRTDKPEMSRYARKGLTNN